MIGSTYNPITTDIINKTYATLYGQGVSSSPTYGQSTNIDLLLSDDVLMTGAWVQINNGCFGDSINLQIIDTNGTYTGVVGSIIIEAIINWYVMPTVDTQFQMPCPAKILAGMTIRIVYSSIGTVNPLVAINYKLHKCLI